MNGAKIGQLARIMARSSNHDLISLFEHDLFGKPVPTFPDHAQAAIMR
jgi:hypothetical protein